MVACRGVTDSFCALSCHQLATQSSLEIIPLFDAVFRGLDSDMMMSLKGFTRATLLTSLFLFAEIVLADSPLWRELAQNEVTTNLSVFKSREHATQPRYLAIDRLGLSDRINRAAATSDGSFLLGLPVPDGGFREFEFKL